MPFKIQFPLVTDHTWQVTGSHGAVGWALRVFISLALSQDVLILTHSLPNSAAASEIQSRCTMRDLCVNSSLLSGTPIPACFHICSLVMSP